MSQDFECPRCGHCCTQQTELLNRLARTDDFVMVHGSELQAILDYVEDMEHRISIVREQLQYMIAESVEDVAEPEA